MPESLLGEYLRACRARVSAADVGLPDYGPRRVPGLRREEVALLAGISPDYYLRLEQGRVTHPSQQVARSIARVLRLDSAATDYLLGLIAPAPPGRLPREEHVPKSVINLLRVLPLPAFVTGQTFDVLASNPAARAVSPELAPGHNRLRSVFLDEAERALYQDWEGTAQRFIAVVRDNVGRHAADPLFAEIVHELSERSEAFARLWARHDVRARDTEPALLCHPVAGEMRLYLERLDVPGVSGESVVIYHADPGSVDAARLAALVARI